MGAETSPVNAPSLLQETFWPATATLEPLAHSNAVEIAVNGGATTMSQCFAPVTSGRNEEKNARVSASVLYIFQFPAITRRRMGTSREDKDNAETLRTQRFRREKRESFVGESFDAGEFASGEKFERPLRESGHFEYSHGTVPDDGLRRGNFLAIGVDSLGTDIEPHPAVGGCGDGNSLRGGIGLEFGADDVINGKK